MWKFIIKFFAIPRTAWPDSWATASRSSSTWQWRLSRFNWKICLEISEKKLEICWKARKNEWRIRRLLYDFVKHFVIPWYLPFTASPEHFQRCYENCWIWSTCQIAINRVMAEMHSQRAGQARWSKRSQVWSSGIEIKRVLESEHVLNTCWIQGFSCCKFLVVKVVLVKVADLCIWKCCEGNGAARRHFEANAVRSTRSAAVRSKAQRCKISQSDQTKHKTSKVQTHSKHQPTSYIILSVVQSPSNKQANIATFRSRKCLRFFSPIRPSSTLPSSRLCAGRGRAGRGGRAGGCCRGRRGRVEFGFSFAWLLAMGIGYMDVGPLNSL